MTDEPKSGTHSEKFLLNYDRMFSGSRPSLKCQSLWRVYSLLRTVRTIKLLINTLKSQSPCYIFVHVPILVHWTCSKASYSGWSSRHYCIQPWCSPTWLCPCNYSGSWRGSHCFFTSSSFSDIYHLMYNNMEAYMIFCS